MHVLCCERQKKLEARDDAREDNRDELERAEEGEKEGVREEIGKRSCGDEKQEPT